MNSNKELEEKIIKGIKQTGFPLEIEIGQYLREKDWGAEHSPFFFDPDDLRQKEYDLKAVRHDDNFSTRLYLECKFSDDKQWVFFAPQKSILTDVYDLKFFPIRPRRGGERSAPLLDETIFKSLRKYCDYSDIAVNAAVFEGNKKSKENTIRNAVETSIKALALDNLNCYWTSTKVSRPKLNLPIVVFDGLMYIYKQTEMGYQLEQRKYIKYRHEFSFSIWKHVDYIKDTPFFRSCSYYEQLVKNRYIVEFVNKEYFPTYLDGLNEEIEELNRISPEIFMREVGLSLK